MASTLRVPVSAFLLDLRPSYIPKCIIREFLANFPPLVLTYDFTLGLQPSRLVSGADAIKGTSKARDSCKLPSLFSPSGS